MSADVGTWTGKQAGKCGGKMVKMGRWAGMIPDAELI